MQAGGQDLGNLLAVVVLTVSAIRMRAGSLRAMQLWARVFAGWVLIVTGGLFALLWLSELVPATLSGQAPASLEVAGLTMNPIHVIDLSVVLPGMIIIGVLALRGNQKGLFLTLPALVFSIADGIEHHRRDGADRRERGHERLGSDGDGRRCCRRQPRSCLAYPRRTTGLPRPTATLQ